MTTNSVKTNDGKGIMLYRAYTPNGSLSSTLRLPPTKYRVGVDQTVATITDTALDAAIPIDDGTVNDDGSNQLTGSDGGDNTTDNTTTFKPGAGVSDVTAQNLIANGTDKDKKWTISDLSISGTVLDEAQHIGLWIYLKDQTTLDKLQPAGWAFEIKFGSDSSNYYRMLKSKSTLSVGWNWISSDDLLLSDLGDVGTPTGTIDYFVQ